MQTSVKILLATTFFSCFSLTIFPDVQQNEKKNVETLTTSACEGDAEAPCLSLLSLDKSIQNQRYSDIKSFGLQ